MREKLQAELQLHLWKRAELAVEALRVTYPELPPRALVARELQLEPEP